MKVPNGWEVKKLKDICTISPPKSKKPINSKVSFIPMSGVCESGKLLNFEENNYDEVCKGFTSFIDNDVIIAKITPCFENGKGAIVSNLINGIGFGSTEFHVLRSKKNTEYKFIYYVTRTKKFIAKGKRNMQGSSGHRRIPADYLKTYKILVPPLPKQRKIAKILGCWDRAIAACEQLIATSKQQKQALMQQLLTAKKRFGEFTGEWQEVRLDSICTRITERNNGKSENVVTVSAKHGLINQKDFFYKSVASTNLNNYFILQKGQFAYNKSYSNGYPMGVIKRLNLYDNAVVTSLYICFKITDDSKNCNSFFEQYFDSGLLNRGLVKIAAEGGRAHGLLNVKPIDFMKLTLIVPCLTEQQKIAQVLTVADSEIEILQQKLAKLQQEKQALMQQLLTGKRRVKVDESDLVTS